MKAVKLESRGACVPPELWDRLDRMSLSLQSLCEFLDGGRIGNLLAPIVEDAFEIKQELVRFTHFSEEGADCRCIDCAPHGGEAEETGGEA